MQNLRFSGGEDRICDFLGCAVLCSAVIGYHCLEGPCCLHPQDWRLEPWRWSSEMMVSNHHTAQHSNQENHEFPLKMFLKKTVSVY